MNIKPNGKRGDLADDMPLHVLLDPGEGNDVDAAINPTVRCGGAK